MIESLSETAEDGDGNVGKTIRLISYRRQKAHVNMWNKADICAVLLSNDSSTAPFLRRPLNLINISRTNDNYFVQEETLRRLNFNENRNRQCRICKALENTRIRTRHFCSPKLPLLSSVFSKLVHNNKIRGEKVDRIYSDLFSSTEKLWFLCDHHISYKSEVRFNWVCISWSWLPKQRWSDFIIISRPMNMNRLSHPFLPQLIKKKKKGRLCQHSIQGNLFKNSEQIV